MGTTHYGFKYVDSVNNVDFTKDTVGFLDAIDSELYSLSQQSGGIAESGSDGDFTWTKFANGLAVVTYQQPNAEYALAAASPIAFRNYQFTVTLPFPMKNVTVSGGFSVSRWWWAGCSGNCTTPILGSTANVVIAGNLSVSSVTAYLRVTFIGYWK